jgi:hypothetical protein
MLLGNATARKVISNQYKTAPPPRGKVIVLALDLLARRVMEYWMLEYFAFSELHRACAGLGVLPDARLTWHPRAKALR